MIVRADLELRSCKKVHSVACKVLDKNHSTLESTLSTSPSETQTLPWRFS